MAHGEYELDLEETADLFEAPPVKPRSAPQVVQAKPSGCFYSCYVCGFGFQGNGYKVEPEFIKHKNYTLALHPWCKRIAGAI